MRRIPPRSVVLAWLIGATLLAGPVVSGRAPDSPPAGTPMSPPAGSPNPSSAGTPVGSPITAAGDEPVQAILYVTADMVYEKAPSNPFGHHRQIVEAMKTAIPSEPVAPYYLWAGDIQYDFGCLDEYMAEGHYEDTYATLPDHDSRVMPVVGNHDDRCAGGLAANYETYFGSDVADPEGGDTYHYSRDFGSWTVIVYNQYADGGTNKLTDPELVWLAAEIDAAGTDCVMVAGHQPAYGSGASHGTNSDNPPDDGDLVPFELMYDKGVEVYVVGHEHIYERTYPLAGAALTRDDQYGVVQVTAGIGGKENWWLAGQSKDNPTPTIVPESASHYSGRWNLAGTDQSDRTTSYMLHGWVRFALYDTHAELSIGREAPGKIGKGTYGVSARTWDDSATIPCHGAHP